MNVTVLYFGVLTQVMNKNTDSLEIPEFNTVNNLIDKLTQDNPVLKKYKFQIAINKQIVSSDAVIKDGDDIALLPPFSGG